MENNNVMCHLFADGFDDSDIPGEITNLDDRKCMYILQEDIKYYNSHMSPWKKLSYIVAPIGNKICLDIIHGEKMIAWALSPRDARYFVFGFISGRDNR